MPRSMLISQKKSYKSTEQPGNNNGNIGHNSTLASLPEPPPAIATYNPMLNASPSLSDADDDEDDILLNDEQHHSNHELDEQTMQHLNELQKLQQQEQSSNNSNSNNNQQVDPLTNINAILYFVNLLNQQRTSQNTLDRTISSPAQQQQSSGQVANVSTRNNTTQPTSRIKTANGTSTKRSIGKRNINSLVVSGSQQLDVKVNHLSTRSQTLEQQLHRDEQQQRSQHSLPSPSSIFLSSDDLIDPLLSSTSDTSKRSSSGSGSGSGDNFVHYCHDCGKRYSTSSNLARHRQTHRDVTDKKAKKCPDCDKIYVSMPAFSMHLRTHNQGCICSICGKSFSRPWLLQGHMRTHTGEKPFRCKICEKAFADKSNLRAHIQTHSDTKPHVCERCNKAFALKSYLCKHVESTCMRANGSQKEPLNLKVSNHPRRNRSNH